MNYGRGPFFLEYRYLYRSYSYTSLIRSLNIKWECTVVNFTESETLNFDPSKTFIGQAPLNISFATRNSVWSSAIKKS